MSEIIAVVRPSLPRRVVAVLTLFALGLMLVYLAFTTAAAASLGWQLFLLAVGVLALVQSDKVRRATRSSIEMTHDVIRDSDGREICRVADIAAVESGVFAFKPSGGFLLRTKTRNARSWAPGLWWRFGRKIGVGGAISAPQAKAMAQLIATMLAENRG